MNNVKAALKNYLHGNLEAANELSPEEYDIFTGHLNDACEDFTDFSSFDLSAGADNTSNDEREMAENPEKELTIKDVGITSRADALELMVQYFGDVQVEKYKGYKEPLDTIGLFWRALHTHLLATNNSNIIPFLFTAKNMHIGKNLLEVNDKLAKSPGIGQYGVGLMLAPNRMAGVSINMCSCATAGCAAACLGHSSGQAALRGGLRADKVKHIIEARIRRTLFFTYNRIRFYEKLNSEIEKHKKIAQQLDLPLGVRLNTLSDLPWESYRLASNSEMPLVQKLWKKSGTIAPSWNLIRAHPDVQFYDYTKVPMRMVQFLTSDFWPKNYHLTFSLSEINLEATLNILSNGGSVAVPFDQSLGRTTNSLYSEINRTSAGALYAKECLPSKFFGFPVIDGDVYDARYADRALCGIPENIGFAVGLRVKRGKPRSFDWMANAENVSGFIQNAWFSEKGYDSENWQELVDMSNAEAEKQRRRALDTAEGTPQTAANFFSGVRPSLFSNLLTYEQLQLPKASGE